ncbi:MAG TPA: pyridoxamine 5'-phosphate oxidase [Acidimicrobiia bacterium]|jgi:PPOX class probable F420-dependent enzyme|nr:pyridoxamine 5'-phosphate oxidase [Acidimicrobiia bacterium]
MATLDDVRRMVAGDKGLATVSVMRDDGSIHSTVVNGGVLAHPITSHDVVGVVVRGNAHKLRLMRRRGRASVTFRNGWAWAGVEGPLDIVGPDDPHDGIDPEGLRLLLQEVFRAAGGTHEDYEEYDRVMAEERRTVVLITPERILGVG